MEMNGVRKGAWTKEEDILLKNCIGTYGEGNWHKVPLRAGLNRCRKSCRLRWLNYLRPNLKRGFFTKDEVDLTIRLHKLLGNRWSLIAGRLPGRTANDVKNFWNTHIAKKTSAESSCRRRSTEKDITEKNIFKPRPRTFSKLHHVPVRPTEEHLNNTQSSSSFSSPRNDSVEFPLKNQAFSLSEDECIRWWGSLLELTENDDGIPFSVTDPTFSSGLTGSGNHQDGLSSLALDADVWGLDSLS